MLAVKAGYVFNLFEEENLKGIELKKTDTKVKVDGVEYSLYPEQLMKIPEELTICWTCMEKKGLMPF